MAKHKHSTKTDQQPAIMLYVDDWMVRRELTQAVPPAYTEWIGRALLEQLT